MVDPVEVALDVADGVAVPVTVPALVVGAVLGTGPADDVRGAGGRVYAGPP